jgi:integrase/recombinase XerD
VPARSPGPEHIREYQAYLFKKRRMAASTVTQHLGALRFFFIKTLGQSWSAAETPYPKKEQRLPVLLSQEEVARLIASAASPVHRILLMTKAAKTGM